MINDLFWKGRRVFITGHTGFKGSWICMWLYSLGAEITGYALDPPTDPSLYEMCEIENSIHRSFRKDIRDQDTLKNAISSSGAEVIFHMAAQPIVRDSYKNPVETYAVNVMGTVNLLDAVRSCKSVRAVVNVTTDKCYENREWVWGYRENEPMGGYDPYSNSKSCSEMVTASFRNSFFNSTDYGIHHETALASARAGNVIGGGDWATDRLVPDCVRALLNKEVVAIRSPRAIRPWQHVLDPLSGYLMLAERLYTDGTTFAEGWNFGPEDNDARPVQWIVHRLCELWGEGAHYSIDTGAHPHEAHYLKLDCSKAKALLGWFPKWNIDMTLGKTVEWIRAYRGGENMKNVCLRHISEYCKS